MKTEIWVKSANKHHCDSLMDYCFNIPSVNEAHSTYGTDFESRDEMTEHTPVMLSDRT